MRIRAAEGPLYKQMIEEVVPFEGARELLAELSEQGRTVILASSAKADEVEHYVDLLGGSRARRPAGPRPPTSRTPSPSPTWSRWR